MCASRDAFLVLMNLIDRYVGRSVLVTAMYGVFVLSVVLVLGNIFKELLDLLINRDVPLRYILLFMLYVLPFSLTFTIPWGFLTAVLLVFGRMSADNEMIALRACGVSLLRVCVPVLAVGAALSLFTFWINATIAPRAEQAMRDSIASMARSNPTALFVPDEVVSQFRGKKIFVGSKNGDVLSDLTIIEQTDGGSIQRVIFAREGVITPNPDTGSLTLNLRDTKFEQRREGEENNVYGIQHGISISEATVNIPLEDLVDEGLRRRPLRSYTLQELRSRFPAVQDITDRVAMLTEMSKRVSLSLACVAFALMAMPLGVTAQRKETSVGFGISLALAFGYFFFVVLAEMLRADAGAYPYLLLWVPNILFVGIGTWLLLRLDYR
jgi:LPS export ABC transporter permease LptF